MNKICEYCNIEFYVEPYRVNKARFCSIRCRAKIVMGCYKFWEGKKRDDETNKKIIRSWTTTRRKNMSKAYSGSGNPMFGKDAWNKNKRCEVLARENNGCWKGDKASYSAKHIWIRVNLGRANKCEDKECLGISKKYHWANISHKYKRERADWKMLCVKCHAKFDRRTKCQ